VAKEPFTQRAAPRTRISARGSLAESSDSAAFPRIDLRARDTTRYSKALSGRTSSQELKEQSVLYPFARAGLALTVLCSFAVSQPAFVPHTVEPYDLDSGYLHNPSATAQVVFQATIVGANKSWMQIHFGDSNLPEGSRLRLTSQLDGAVQWFDGASLRDYANRSAFFNGNGVLLELVAGANSRANRVQVVGYMGGDGFPISQTAESQCGSTDDRVPSSDPRQGRQWPSTCTTWMINPTTVLTAGHCASRTQQVHFNVPLSSNSGSIILPPPDDQYAYDGPTLQQLNAGVGADWSVVAVVRNSNTGLYPGQAQGSWYDLGPVPTSRVGLDHIRITGYGSTTSSVPRSWNFAQKTHLGGFTSTTATSLRYRTDTSGGNSGSPVVHEETGNAIGIHTHAGCTVSGGSNQGTRIDRADLQAAIAAIQNLRIAGIFEQVGNGCAGAGGTPALSSVTFPDLGNTMTLDVTGVEPNQAGTMFFGATDVMWAGNTLPFSLVSMGLPACNIYVSLDLAQPLASGPSGTPSMSFSIPNDPTLTGALFFNQYISLDSSNGLTVTNGAKSTVGD